MLYLLIFILFSCTVAESAAPALAVETAPALAAKNDSVDGMLKAIDSLKKALDRRQSKSINLFDSLQESDRLPLVTTSAIAASDDQAHGIDTGPLVDNPKDSFLAQRVAPVGVAAAAGIGTAMILQNISQPVQRRSLLSAGDAFGAAGAAKAGAIVAVVAVGSYWLSRLLSGLHRGCRADLIEAKQSWKDSLTEALQKHMAEVQKQNTETINKLNAALNAQSDETHELISPIVEALEHSVSAFGQTPDMEKIQKEFKESVERAKRELSVLQHRPHNPIAGPVNTPGITFVQPKEKCCSCC
jgi:hypothetical protein